MLGWFDPEQRDWFGDLVIEGWFCDEFVAAATSGVTGTLAVTLGVATLSGEADVGVVGALAKTLDDATLSGTGNVTGGVGTVTGILATTLGAITLSGNALVTGGVVPVPGGSSSFGGGMYDDRFSQRQEEPIQVVNLNKLRLQREEEEILIL